MNGLTKAASDVLAERQRQVEKEGWTPEHDDEHRDGSMARAAAAYCLCAEGPPRPGEPSEFHSSRPWDFNILRAIWPRSWGWPQPKDRRRNLVRAAALLLAEIERLDRADAAREEARADALREEARAPGVGVGGKAQQEKELGACSLSRATIGDRTHDRRSEASDQRLGGEEQGRGEAGRCDAVRAGGTEPGARGSNAAQHEVATEPGPCAPAQPLDMLLFCPKCHTQHVDEPDERTPGWVNPPHRSHLCHACGTIWRPADVPTNGVREVKTRGKADTWPCGVKGTSTTGEKA